MTVPAPFQAVILLRNAHVVTLQELALTRESVSVSIIPGRAGASIVLVKAPRAELEWLFSRVPARPQGRWIAGITTEGKRWREPGYTNAEWAAEWQSRKADLLAVLPQRLDPVTGLPAAVQPTTMRGALAHVWYGDAAPDDDEEPEAG